MSAISIRFVLLLLTLAPASGFAQSGDAVGTKSAWSGRPLRSGDVVRLRIWREGDMSGDFTIDQNGIVVLPRVGRMQVVNESPEVVERKIIQSYERFLQHSSIEVVLLRRIQVLGAVRTPGLYPVDGTMTVSDVLALAGGTTTQGHPDRIELIRAGDRIAARLSASARIVDSPIQSGDQLYVPERSWFSRNSGVIAAGLTSVLIAFLTR